MTNGLSRGTTEFAKQVWRDINAAAAQAPEWVKAQVTRAAEEAAREMEQRAAAVAQLTAV